MLTLDGRCKTLDASADGYVRAEACTGIYLSASGDASPGTSSTVYIRSTFVNQDGRSSSLTAPNGPSQQGVIRGALAAAAASPQDVQLLEMHGTGTPLGDPIEVGAAAAVFQGRTGVLQLTAAKSRMGHAEPAAGQVGMVQLSQMLSQMTTRCMTHLRTVNHHISSLLEAHGKPGPAMLTIHAARADVQSSALHAAENAWERTASVSAFAFQGTNAHARPSHGTPVPHAQASFASPEEAEGGLYTVAWEAQTPIEFSRSTSPAHRTSLCPTMGLAVLAHALGSTCLGSCHSSSLVAAPFIFARICALDMPFLPLFDPWRPEPMSSPPGQFAQSGPLQGTTAVLPHGGRVSNSTGGLRSAQDIMEEGMLGCDIGLDQPLMEAGLDSLGAVELRNTISSQFNIDLPATVMFDYPSISALAGFIASQAGTCQHRPSTQPLSALRHYTSLQVGQSVQSGLQDPTYLGAYIVSAASCYPTAPTGPESFWSTLTSGRDVQSLVPYSRWDMDAVYAPDPGPGRMTIYARFGGFCRDVDLFDAGLFRMAPTEAVAVDPQQRLLMEQAYLAQSEASAVLGHTMGSATGVYVGCMYHEYIDVMVQSGAQPPSQAFIGNGPPYLVGRLSYGFGWTGPCISTDTACSSSLVATHLAQKGLMNGEAKAALAGGTNAMLLADTTAGICQLQALSPVGRCQSFDAAADGYGRGEGFAAIIMVPALIRAALTMSHLSPQHLALVSVHGTGTQLGDPIERALRV
ncbi:hypothetical protein WJX84_003543 [Apatococcus fuscideae]|uniref:Uncharacterized protein n=1 Tax=Apatococcus fuscideae TaxID=2026836 RepID=A0AAW1RUC1_9CHLO